MTEKIYILGISDDGWRSLTRTAQAVIEAADVLVGPENILAAVPPQRAERVPLGADLEAAVAVLAKRASDRVVVLASGDPLFYGTARYLCNRLGKDRFEVIPHVSSMQLAFARVKESWEEAYLTNLATRPLEASLEQIRISEKVGIFTSDAWPPGRIARELLVRQIDYFSAYVCENLGSPDERVTQAELGELAELEFSPLNCLILVRKPDVPDRPVESLGRRLFGNPDELFSQSKPKRGLLTPAEIRSIALAEMDLGPQSVVWDVGAGSGSVAVEAAQIARHGHVFAVEMDPEDHALILENAQRFATGNLEAVLGRAPEALDGLPPPDSVFIGGTGRDVSLLVEAAYVRLKPGGRLVTNLASIENLHAINDFYHRQGLEPKVWMLSLSRGLYQLERLKFESLNPTFLLAVVKPNGSTTAASSH